MLISQEQNSTFQKQKVLEDKRDNISGEDFDADHIQNLPINGAQSKITICIKDNLLYI